MFEFTRWMGSAERAVGHDARRMGASSRVGKVHVMNAIPVDAVVFDLGQVLIAWDPHPAIAKGVGQEQAKCFLADSAFDFFAWNHQQDAGRSWDQGEEVAVTSHPHWDGAIRAYR